MNLTILVADGDAAMRTVIQDILVGDGHQVATASDLDAALAAMDDGRTGLAFLAHDLEDGEGNRLCSRVERLSLPVPVVVVVDAAMDDPLDAVRRCKAQSYLKKPVDRSRLLMAAEQGLAAGELSLRLARRENEFARTRAFLRAMADVGGGGVVVLDADGVVVECGGNVVELPGFDVGSARGKPYLSLLPESVAELHEGLLDRARDTGEPARIEEHRSGMVVETVVRFVPGGNGPAGCILVRRDITAQRRNETGPGADGERYRQVFEGAGLAVLVLERGSGRIETANKAASRSLGQDRRI